MARRLPHHKPRQLWALIGTPIAYCSRTGILQPAWFMPAVSARTLVGRKRANSAGLALACANLAQALPIWHGTHLAECVSLDTLCQPDNSAPAAQVHKPRALTPHRALAHRFDAARLISTIPGT